MQYRSQGSDLVFGNMVLIHDPLFIVLVFTPTLLHKKVREFRFSSEPSAVFCLIAALGRRKRRASITMSTADTERKVSWAVYA